MAASKDDSAGLLLSTSLQGGTEQRLKAASKDGVDPACRRQLLVFDRFLARVSAVLGDPVLLKGGLVLELRLARARTTKDVDLRVTGSPTNVLASLQQAGRQELGDFMTFEVSPDAEHSNIEHDGIHLFWQTTCMG